MTKTTMLDLRRVAPTAEIYDDPDTQCYRATAPVGSRWDYDLHELIAVYGDGLIGNGATKAEARADLAARLAEYVKLGAPEPCDVACCDWCAQVTEQ